MKFTIYDNRSGEVLRYCTATHIENVRSQVMSGSDEIYIGVHLDHDEYYFINGEPQKRAEMQFDVSRTLLDVGDTEVAVGGLPSGTLVAVGAGPFVECDGVFRFKIQEDVALTICPPFPWRHSNLVVRAA